MSSVQLGEPGLAHRANPTATNISASRRSTAARSKSRYRSHSTASRPPKLAVELKLQGCADAGLCYPPQKWQHRSCRARSLAGKKPGADLRSFLKSRNAANDEFLPPDEAFRFGAGMERADSVALTWVIADGYYLYKHRISVTTDATNVQIGSPLLPKGDPKHDEFFGDTEVYHEFLEASLPVARAAGSTGTLALNVTYQGCAEGGLCYNPITKTVALELPPTDVATTLPAAAATASAGSGQPVAEQDSFAGTGTRWQRAAVDRDVLWCRAAAGIDSMRAAHDSDPVRNHRRPGRQDHTRSRDFRSRLRTFRGWH